MKKRTLINEVRQLQKIAGLLKEDKSFDIGAVSDSIINHSNIDPTKPITVISVYGNHRESVQQLSSEDLEQDLISTLLDYKDNYENESDMIEDIHITTDPTQGQGELVGDDNQATEGLTCKAEIYLFGDWLFEIWQ